MVDLSSSNPIRWRPRADPVQKRDPGERMTQKGLTIEGPLQKGGQRRACAVPTMHPNLFSEWWGTLPPSLFELRRTCRFAHPTILAQCVNQFTESSTSQVNQENKSGFSESIGPSQRPYCSQRKGGTNRFEGCNHDDAEQYFQSICQIGRKAEPGPTGEITL